MTTARHVHRSSFPANASVSSALLFPPQGPIPPNSHLAWSSINTDPSGSGSCRKWATRLGEARRAGFFLLAFPFLLLAFFPPFRSLPLQPAASDQVSIWRDGQPAALASLFPVFLAASRLPSLSRSAFPVLVPVSFQASPLAKQDVGMDAVRRSPGAEGSGQGNSDNGGDDRHL